MTFGARECHAGWIPWADVGGAGRERAKLARLAEHYRWELTLSGDFQPKTSVYEIT